jgi:hypothetical protein
MKKNLLLAGVAVALLASGGCHKQSEPAATTSATQTNTTTATSTSTETTGGFSDLTREYKRTEKKARNAVGKAEESRKEEKGAE